MKSNILKKYWAHLDMYGIFRIDLLRPLASHETREVVEYFLSRFGNGPEGWTRGQSLNVRVRRSSVEGAEEK